MKKLLFIALLLSSPFLYSQNFDWAKAISGGSTQQINSIVTDKSGNTYSVGIFKGTGDFDPGMGVTSLSSNGNYDFFLLKLDSIGQFQWVKQFGGAGIDEANSIAIDNHDNLIITGNYRGTVDFDPNAGVTNLSSSGYGSLFVMKMTAQGNLVWAKGMASTTNFPIAYSVAVDNHGSVYSTGKHKGNIDFDPGIGTHFKNALGVSDIYIQKLDSSGNFVWVHTFGSNTPFLEQGKSIVIDNSNHIFVTGTFAGVVDFDQGIGVKNLTAASGAKGNLFILKYTLQGNFVWAKNIGSNSTIHAEYGYDIAVDRLGNSYITGQFTGTVDFDPDTTSVQNLTPNGGQDIFVLKLDSIGSYKWAIHMGGSGIDEGLAIATDYFGNVYITGKFGGSSDFNPGTGVDSLTSNGLYDVFIQKLSTTGSLEWVKQIGASGYDIGNTILVEENGNTIYTGGSFYRTVDFDTDTSIYTLTSAGLSDGFIHKLRQPIRCIPSSSSITVSSCFKYTSPSGELWTSSGVYQDTILNHAGCDSVLTINLTVLSLDRTIANNGVSLTANESAATFQWLKCFASYAIVPGAINQSFTPTSNGIYAVEITKNGCVDTSICEAIFSVGLDEFDNNFLSVYPNPTSNKLFIELPNRMNEIITVRIISSNGKLLFSETVKKQHKLSISTKRFPPGFYVVEIQTKNKLFQRKIIKE